MCLCVCARVCLYMCAVVARTSKSNGLEHLTTTGCKECAAGCKKCAAGCKGCAADAVSLSLGHALAGMRCGSEVTYALQSMQNFLLGDFVENSLPENFPEAHDFGGANGVHEEALQVLQVVRGGGLEIRHRSRLDGDELHALLPSDRVVCVCA